MILGPHLADPRFWVFGGRAGVLLGWRVFPFFGRGRGEGPRAGRARGKNARGERGEKPRAGTARGHHSWRGRTGGTSAQHGARPRRVVASVGGGRRSCATAPPRPGCPWVGRRRCPSGTHAAVRLTACPVGPGRWPAPTDAGYRAAGAAEAFRVAQQGLAAPRGLWGPSTVLAPGLASE